MSNKILNKDQMSEIITESLKNVTPNKLMKKACSFENNELDINGHKIYIPKNKKIHVFGSGKAVLSMAESLNDILGEKIEKMILVGPYETDIDLPNMQYLKSTHPLPSSYSIDAAIKISNELAKLNEDDIFIYLLSGGNSALVELPVYDIGLEDFQETTSLMLKGAMPIEAMNCVRKHLSQVKGGRMGSFTTANGYVMVLSDVMQDSFEDIGSAPFYYDKTTFEDAVNYLKEYKLYEKIPVTVKKYLQMGLNKDVRDTLKKELVNVQHFLIGSNSIFLNSIKEELSKNSLVSKVYLNSVNKDVDEVCKEVIDFSNSNEKGCYIFGGEATVLVKGEGKGGRNQHLVLKLLESYPKDKDIIFLSVASDGIDGNSDAAGAIIDKETLQKSKELNLDLNKYLENFDSNSFFDKLNQLIKPGPTHNNMLDALVVYIK